MRENRPSGSMSGEWKRNVSHRATPRLHIFILLLLFAKQSRLVYTWLSLIEMTMYLANIHKAKTQLSNLINRALAGEEVIIARAGLPLVRLVPVQRDTSPRQGGQLRGQIPMREDFDAVDQEIERLFSA